MSPDPIFPYVDGWRRVLSAPAIAAGGFVITLLLALPLGYAMRGMLEAHLGRSTIAAAVADGIEYDWWQEFTSQTSGIGATFTPPSSAPPQRSTTSAACSTARLKSDRLPRRSAPGSPSGRFS